jgi:hypothetical protein
MIATWALGSGDKMGPYSADAFTQLLKDGSDNEIGYCPSSGRLRAEPGCTAEAAPLEPALCSRRERERPRSSTILRWRLLTAKTPVSDGNVSSGGFSPQSCALQFGETPPCA